MRQVLFRLPIPVLWPNGIPIYGFGAMLVVALFLCVWVAGRRAQKQGIAKETIQDLAFWVVIGGILGARLVFMVQYGQPLEHFFYFWEGGLVWYGGLLGGVIGFFCAYLTVFRKLGLSAWKLGDIIAPALALGLSLGRVGCLLNGCCWGAVAGPQSPALTFPVQSFAGGIGSSRGLVPEGYQALAGFVLSPEAVDPEPRLIVAAVDASSTAARAGLQSGDQIETVNGQEVKTELALERYLSTNPNLQLTVQRDGQTVALPAFQPQTLGLYPTQVFESVSMILLFLFLMAYFPYRRHDGEVLLLFLTLYPLHRFLNEMLRNDTDPVAFGLTLSQNGSLLILGVALCLWVWVLRRPAQYHPFAAKKAEPAPAVLSPAPA
jgi:phosphatidylglycerol:prolipoprotein diacylglycerol transferase